MVVELGSIRQLLELAVLAIPLALHLRRVTMVVRATKTLQETLVRAVAVAVLMPMVLTELPQLVELVVLVVLQALLEAQ